MSNYLAVGVPSAIDPNSISSNMDRNTASVLSSTGPGMIVRQTLKGWFQTLCGCDANEEFKITNNQGQEIMYAKEDTNCCVRLCCHGNRPMTINVSAGNTKGGQQLLTVERPLKCHAHPCKLCCYQEISIKDASNNNLGKVVESCWICVPQFEIKRPDDSVEFVLHQPTCCGGMCIDFCAEGLCRVPFDIYEPAAAGLGREASAGKITKIWAGLLREAFTNAHSFELVTKVDHSPMTKARILAATFLINQVFFQKDSGAEKNADF